jgi:O-antigen/teichoic acid export membrane protein
VRGFVLRVTTLLEQLQRRNPLPAGTVSVAQGLIVSGLAGYGFLALSARALGPERYGALAALWLLAFTTGTGLFLPLEQEVSRALSSRRAAGLGSGPLIYRAGLAGLAMATAFVAVAVFAAGPLERNLFDGETLLVIGFAVSLVAYAVEHVVRGVLSGNGLFRPYGLIVGLEAVARLVGCALLVALGVAVAGPYGVVLGAAPLIAVLPTLRAAHRTLAPGPDAGWQELSRALGWLLGASLAAQVLVNAAPLAVQLLATESEQAIAGRFLAGLVIARLPLFFFAAIQAALLPKLSGLVGSDRLADFRRGMRMVLLVVGSITGAATLTMLTIGPLVVRILFGEGFEMGRRDLALLAAATGGYMVALVLAQALIALSRYVQVCVGWLLGLAALVVVTAVVPDLLLRAELGFLAGAVVSAYAMARMLRSRLRAGAPAPGQAAAGSTPYELTPES